MGMLHAGTLGMAVLPVRNTLVTRGFADTWNYVVLPVAERKTGGDNVKDAQIF